MKYTNRVDNRFLQIIIFVISFTKHYRKVCYILLNNNIYLNIIDSECSEILLRSENPYFRLVKNVPNCLHHTLKYAEFSLSGTLFAQNVSKRFLKYRQQNRSTHWFYFC